MMCDGCWNYCLWRLLAIGFIGCWSRCLRSLVVLNEVFVEDVLTESFPVRGVVVSWDHLGLIAVFGW